MGKKRRLIKTNSKFNNKYSAHPRYKYLYPESEDKSEIREEETVVEIKETPPPVPVVEEKPKPVLKPEPKLKKVQAKKRTTSKAKRKSTPTYKIKKTKQAND